MIDLSQPPILRNPRLIVITMSRDWMRDPHHPELAQTRADLTHETLSLIHSRWPGALLVHGDEPNGDRRAADLWLELAGDPDLAEPVPADWDLCAPSCPAMNHRRRTNYPRGREYCPKAGHRRNSRMVNWVAGQRAVGACAVAVAFILNGSAGATDCLAKMRAAGLPVHAIHRAAPRARPHRPQRPHHKAA